MKVLFITHNDGLLGSSRSLLDLLVGLGKYQINPIVVIPKEGLLEKKLIDLGIPIRIISLPWWVSTQTHHLKSTVSNIREMKTSIHQLVSLIKLQSVDLVYTNSSVTPVGRIAALLAGVPHIWHIREFGNLDFSLSPMIPKSIFRQIIYSSQAVICNSQAIKKHYFENRISGKLHVVYNGVASEEQITKNTRSTMQESQRKEYTFLFIGSISPPKGLEEAIMALQELRCKGINSRLIIVGTGKQSYIEKCSDLAYKLQVADSVEFMGYLDDPSEVYSAADCLLMCSKNEAFGRVTAEAMSACLPVIGKNSGGTPEVVVDGKTGILYDTEEELETAMIWMVQHPAEASQMGLAGWKRAKELFNIEDCAAKVFEIIQSVTKQA